jgi:hypothetical protein
MACHTGVITMDIFFCMGEVNKKRGCDKNKEKNDMNVFPL